MITSAYEKALDTAYAEIGDLTVQRNELDKRIARLQATAEALTSLIDISPASKSASPEAISARSEAMNGHPEAMSARSEPISVRPEPMTAPLEPWIGPPEQEEEPGISEAIRHVLRTSPVPLTRPEIKAKLTEAGFDNVISITDGSVVDQTLKRLEQKGDVSLVGSVYLAVSL